MTQSQQLVVPSFPISSNCKKGMKMCYDCAPKTISPPSFWVHGFFSPRNLKKNWHQIQALKFWNFGGPMCILREGNVCVYVHARILHIYCGVCTIDLVYRLFLPTWFYRIIFLDLFAQLFGPVIRGGGESSISTLFLSKRCLTWVNLWSNVWTL
jgi:hypothetical protein